MLIEYTKFVNQTSSFDPETIINPFYAVSLADDLFKQSMPKVDKEDWMLLNTNLIEDIGASTWLDELLEVMSRSRNEYDGHDIINPALTVSISTGLQGAHQPIVERREWIAANIKLMEDMGTYKWLELLLSILVK